MALAPRSFDRDPDRVAHLYEHELERFVASTTASKALYERAVESMPLGVTSSCQKGDPHPIYLRSGKGSRLEDVDGNSYIDYHAGFGTMVVGHAHPKVRE